MALPARLAKPLSEALAAHAAQQTSLRFRAVATLMKELGLERASHPASVTAAELEGDRRTVLAELTRAGISVRGGAELPDPWELRRLVGLAPPGILEELGAGWGASFAAVKAALAKAPAARRIEAHVEAELASWSVLNPSVIKKLRADAPAALAYARATLPLLEPNANVLARALLFTAFSASGATVPEGADERFPFGPAELLVEHLLAIAPDRRDVVLSGMFAGQKTSANLEPATLLVEKVPGLPRTIATLRKLFDRLRKQRLTPYEKKALVALDRRLQAVEKGSAKAIPAKAKLAATKEAKLRTLVVTARRSPRKPTELGALAAKQLVEAGRRFDGKALPAARRLSLDENDEAALGAVLEHVTIAEGKKPVFEAWLHGDAGTFFAAGTCDVVALRGDGVTALEDAKGDPSLEAALHAIGPSKAAIRSVKAVRSATAKKPTPKKKARSPRRA